MPHGYELDTHFLIRIAARLEGREADLANLIYRDRRVHQALLARLPFRGDTRFAVRLRNALPSPHLVLSADGGFITCLGPGMSTGDLPTVPRRILEDVMGQMEEVRRRERCAAEALQQADAPGSLLELAWVRGPSLTREEFIGVASRYSGRKALGEAVSFINKTYKHRRLILNPMVTRISAGPDFIDSMWDAFWTTAHLGMLAALDGFKAEDEQLAAQDVARILWERKNVAMGARALAIAAELSLDDGFNYFSELTWMPDGAAQYVFGKLGLLTIALRRPSRRPTVEKAWRRGACVELLPNGLARSLAAIDLKLEAARELVLDNAELAFEELERLGREVLGPDASQADAVTAALQDLGNPMTDDAALHRIVVALPLLANARAEAFVLPKAAGWKPKDFSHAEKLELMCRPYVSGLRRETDRNARQPKPNEACGCGSGRKFKKCCAGRRAA